MKLTGYIKCPSCNQIFKDPHKITTNLSNPTPCCTAREEMRELWPPLDILILKDIVEKQDINDYKQRKVAIVFVCTILESLLEEVILTLVTYHYKSNRAIEALLDAYQGRNKRINLFNKLNANKLSEILKSIGNNSFLTEWDTMARLRNEVVHRGSYKNRDSKVDVIIKTLLDNCIDVFAIINNEIIKSNTNL